MQRTLTAMFDTRAEAERAAGTLRGVELGAENIRLHQAEMDGTESGGSPAGPDAPPRREDRGFFGAIADLFVPDEDRATYSEGLRRGATLLLAEVDDAHLHQVMDAMEAAGAVDLDAREADWRQQGWSGGSMAGVSSGSVESSLVMPDMDARTDVGDARPAQDSGGGGTAGMPSAYGATAAGGGPAAAPATQRDATGGGDAQAGRRESHAGRVRVRSYVAETPPRKP